MNTTHKLATTTILAMALLLTGCGDSHDAVAADSVSLMKELTAVLENIKDVDSAKAAVPKLEALAERSKGLKERMKAVGDPTPEQEKELKAKYEGEMKEIMPKMMGAMMRIGMNPEIQKVLEAPMEKIEQNMN